MPSIKKGFNHKWTPKRKAQEGRRNNNYKFYNSQKWRKCATTYRLNNPLCEVCQANSIITGSEVTDHIITINEGGAVFDNRNHMAMCHQHHNTKSGKEKHQATLTTWKYNEQGDKIPVDRNDIITLLINYNQ